MLDRSRTRSLRSGRWVCGPDPEGVHGPRTRLRDGDAGPRTDHQERAGQGYPQGTAVSVHMHCDSSCEVLTPTTHMPTASLRIASLKRPHKRPRRRPTPPVQAPARGLQSAGGPPTHCLEQIHALVPKITREGLSQSCAERARDARRLRRVLCVVVPGAGARKDARQDTVEAVLTVARQ